MPIRCKVVSAYKEATGNVSKTRWVQRHHSASAVDVCRTVCQGLSTNKDAFLVQELTLVSLPCGLAVLSGKARTSNLPRVKVTLVKNSDSSVTVKRRQVVADLFSIQAEYAISSVVQELNSQETGGTHILPLGETTELILKQKTKLASRFRFGEDADPVWKGNFIQ